MFPLGGRPPSPCESCGQSSSPPLPALSCRRLLLRNLCEVPTLSRAPTCCAIPLLWSPRRAGSLGSSDSCPLSYPTPTSSSIWLDKQSGGLWQPQPHRQRVMVQGQLGAAGAARVCRGAPRGSRFWPVQEAHGKDRFLLACLLLFSLPFFSCHLCLNLSTSFQMKSRGCSRRLEKYLFT